MDESRLEGISLFAGLSKRERGKVAREMREVKLAQGDHLVDEGEFSLDFFVICEGTAVVVASGKHLTDLGPGDFLGEIGLLRDAWRSASVIAATPITALAIPRRDLQGDDEDDAGRREPDRGGHRGAPRAGQAVRAKTVRPRPSSA